jgi:hypothetical protein
VSRAQSVISKLIIVFLLWWGLLELLIVTKKLF